MKITEAGHMYELEDYDQKPGEHYGPNNLFFMKRVGGHYPGNTGEPHHGTNCQEVLRVLIDRVKYLNNQIPCKENEEIIRYLRYTIYLFEKRAAMIHGHPLKEDEYSFRNNEIEFESTCKTCGHIGCKIKEHNNDLQRLSNGCEIDKSLP